MKEWYRNKKITIFFSEVPCITMRIIVPSMPLFMKKSIMRYPFCNKREFTVTIFNHEKSIKHEFPIFRGYCYDGATIPRFLHRVIGSNTSPEFLIPSCIHDVLCENREYIDYDRKLSSDIFCALLIGAGVNKFKAYLMSFFVDLYQRTQRWRKNGKTILKRT